MSEARTPNSNDSSMRSSPAAVSSTRRVSQEQLAAAERAQAYRIERMRRQFALVPDYAAPSDAEATIADR